jgi:hypothetical protein
MTKEFTASISRVSTYSEPYCPQGSVTGTVQVCSDRNKTSSSATGVSDWVVCHHELAFGPALHCLQFRMFRALLYPQGSVMGTEQVRSALIKEEILEPILTRPRDAAGWSKGKREILGSVNFRSVETAKARSRKGRTNRPGFEELPIFGKARPLEKPGTTTGLGTAGSEGWIFGSYLASDGTGTGASAGRHTA